MQEGIKVIVKTQEIKVIVKTQEGIVKPIGISLKTRDRKSSLIVRCSQG